MGYVVDPISLLMASEINQFTKSVGNLQVGKLNTSIKEFIVLFQSGPVARTSNIKDCVLQVAPKN